MNTRTFDLAPLVAMAGRDFSIRWPTTADLFALGAALPRRDSTPAIWGTFLAVLGDLPKATAVQMALAYPDEVPLLISLSLRARRDAMASDDARRDCKIVGAILSGIDVTPVRKALDLLVPVEFRGETITSLTMAPITTAKAGAVLRANRRRTSRNAIVSMIAIATDQPRALITNLIDADLERAGELIAVAYRAAMLSE